MNDCEWMSHADGEIIEERADAELSQITGLDEENKMIDKESFQIIKKAYEEVKI